MFSPVTRRVGGAPPLTFFAVSALLAALGSGAALVPALGVAAAFFLPFGRAAAFFATDFAPARGFAGATATPDAIEPPPTCRFPGRLLTTLPSGSSTEYHDVWYNVTVPFFPACLPLAKTTCSANGEFRTGRTESTSCFLLFKAVHWVPVQWR